MAKKSAAANFWRSDWFTALAVILAVFVLSQTTRIVDVLDGRVYDSGMSASSRKASDEIAVIAIDLKSIENIGRWPWSREVHAKFIDKLAQAKVKVIGYPVFFSEPQIDKGYAYIKQVRDVVVNSGLDPATSPLHAPLLKILDEADVKLNTDGILATSIAGAGNVVLPTVFAFSGANPIPGEPIPEFMRKSVRPGTDGIPVERGEFPIAAIGAAATGLGHLNQQQDDDGKVRKSPLFVQYNGSMVPSLSLMIAAKRLNVDIKDIKFSSEAAIANLGDRAIVTDHSGQFRPFFYEASGKNVYLPDSFFDVLSGTVPASKFAGKIVIVGPTVSGLTTLFSVPIASNFTPAELLAHETSSILSQHFIREPWWAGYINIGVFLLVAVFSVLLLPKLSAGRGAVAAGALFASLLVLQFGMMTFGALWVPMMVSAIALLASYLVITVKRFFTTEQGKEKSDSASAESNRMLGLSYQGQGQLDQAFDKYRSVPMGDALMDNLYNLALDFERKRQFNKAQAVYEHMSAYDADYKDLKAKLNRAKTMSETVIFGGTQSKGPGTSIINPDGSIEKPMLGRYQVEKELGKGAMGIVYLGKDPKIGRLVAIKTMALAQEFEGDELEDVRQRFFREAETAGRLQHPQIVTIFDAGEEHDLAFIAMELLKGQDLVPYCKVGALLPMDKVVSIVARVADALGYAHQQNVVHRDIKPANVMYDLEKDVVKVTDFGIARITDSSKTKTGIVLGTPSFMSPEQISGAKVDGRSDLYSLAVTLYQMLTGRLPFVGESMAELMYKIANGTPIDPREVRPDLPEELAQVCLFGMGKKPEGRYQNGEQMAQDLRRILTGLQQGGKSAGDVDVSF